MGANPIFDDMGATDRDMWEWWLGKAFLVDVALVTTVSGDKTRVDVRHAALLNVRGQQLPPTETKGVELMFPGGGSVFSARWDVAVGDIVLLVATKDHLDPVAGLAAPAVADSGAHYTQDTMKAVPVAPFRGGSSHTVEVSASEIVVDGGTKGAARQDDSVSSNSSTDTAFWTWLTAAAAVLAGFGVVVPPPTSLTGKISAGSTKVKVG